MEAVKQAGPNTQSFDGIFELDKAYPTSGTGWTDKDIILLNYSPEDHPTRQDALTWAESRNLKKTGSRNIFAIAKENPLLHQELYCCRIPVTFWG